MPLSRSACRLCRDIGWVLECNDLGKPGPRMLEMLACPIPDCEASGQPVQRLSFTDTRFGHVARHPSQGYVMSIGARP